MKTIKCKICKNDINVNSFSRNNIICDICMIKECLECGIKFKVIKQIRFEKSKFCSRKCASKYISRGRVLSEKHKQSLSNSASPSKGGFVKTKFYPIFSKYMNKIVKVQGTFELKFAEWLNENNIDWIKSRKLKLNYRFNNNDILRNYFPDFYLIDDDEYIEIKGFWWGSDKLKMKCVKEYNQDKKITILMKDDLKNIGVF